jgi:hypothetical protein
LPTEFAALNRKEGRDRYFLDADGSVYDRGSVAKPPAPKAPAFALPTRQSQLPTTREGYDALAKAINKAGGINGSFIQVYAGSSVANIKKNFVKRLGLAGK